MRGRSSGLVVRGGRGSACWLGGPGSSRPRPGDRTTAGGGLGNGSNPLLCITGAGAAGLRCAARRQRTKLGAATGGGSDARHHGPEHEGWRVWTATNGAETLAGVGATRPISRTCTRPSPTAAAPRVAGPLGPGVSLRRVGRTDVGLLAHRPGLTSTLSRIHTTPRAPVCRAADGTSPLACSAASAADARPSAALA